MRVFSSLFCKPTSEAQREMKIMQQLWHDGSERGTRMMQFLRQQLDRLMSDLAVLEIGVGGGGIANVFARHAKYLVGGDCCRDTLRSVSERKGYRQSPFSLVELDAVSLPFSEKVFDLVLLNGVLEYMGCRNGPLTPQAYQHKALAEIQRVLKPRGVLYLATENRWYPGNLLDDPHTHQPFVSFLPRRLADRYSQTHGGRPYRHWLHSLNGLIRLIRDAGFHEIHPFIPHISYQFPRDIIPAHARWQFLRHLYRGSPGLSDDFRCVTDVSWRSKLWLSVAALLGLHTRLASSFVILARKADASES